MRRAMLLSLALGAIGTAHSLKTSRHDAVVHGTVGRDASLSLLRRRAPLGRLRCDLLVPRSTTRAVLRACIALRHGNSYSILQIGDSGASMYVCRVQRDGVHRVAAILSTNGETPLRSLKDAVAWHHSVFPNMTLCL